MHAQALVGMVNAGGVKVTSGTVAHTFLALTCCFKFLRKQLVHDVQSFVRSVSCSDLPLDAKWQSFFVECGALPVF
jgi:hypothetical protein